MSADALTEWMARFSELDDAAVGQLLRGDTPAGCEDLAPVAELVLTLRERATADGPQIGASLRAQMQQRPRVAPRYVGVARRRLQLAAVAAALVLIGVAASHNALPAAAQRIVSNAADLAGIDVPRPGEDRDHPPSTSSAGTDTSGSTGTTDGTETSDPTTGTKGGAPSTGGPPEQTPGGAIPADPGAPHDGEPATPATPPPHSNGGGNGNNGTGSGNGRATAPGQIEGQGATHSQG